MKKIICLLMFIMISIGVYAEDKNAYVSDIQHYNGYTTVKVTAKESALRQYESFVVDVRPANHIFDMLLTTSRAAKPVTLTRENPTAEVYFYCDENYSGKKACNRNDFVIKSRL